MANLENSIFLNFPPVDFWVETQKKNSTDGRDLKDPLLIVQVKTCLIFQTVFFF